MEVWDGSTKGRTSGPTRRRVDVGVGVPEPHRRLSVLVVGRDTRWCVVTVTEGVDPTEVQP